MPRKPLGRSEHGAILVARDKEVTKAGLPVLSTRLHRLVAFQEMSFTGVPPTTGLAGFQTSNFLYDLEALGGLPETTKLAS
jgi:hypothetical protein